MKMLSNGILCPSSALLYPILSQEQSQSTAGALLVKIPIITSPCTNARAGLRTPGGEAATTPLCRWVGRQQAFAD